jgi:hypothetical protein
MGHVHAHAPHELSEPSHGDDRPAVGRAERVIELAAVLLMSLATVATAWSGYQAARWSGEQAQHYARAAATRIKAQQQATVAGQQRIDDILFFDGWLDAREAGDTELAAIYRRRFRPAFEPAFRAWLASRPFDAAAPAVAGPTALPEYRPVELQRSAALDREADALFEEGTTAKADDDQYILSTVFFAAVLFFAGISLRLEWRRLRLAVLGLAGAMLLGGIAMVATLPVS